MLKRKKIAKIVEKKCIFASLFYKKAFSRKKYSLDVAGKSRK